MDIIEYISKSTNMYFGKINEGYKYIHENVTLWDSIIVYYFAVLISMTSAVLIDTKTYQEFGGNIGLIIVGMFFISLLLFPLIILIGYGIMHIFLKIFGGNAKFEDTIKFAISATIFGSIIATIISILKNLIDNSVNKDMTIAITFTIVWMFISISIGIWNLVILVMVLSKVHKISQLRTFLALITPAIILIIIVVLIAFIVGILIAASGM